jgi:hypothetical protein
MALVLFVLAIYGPFAVAQHASSPSPLAQLGLLQYGQATRQYDGGEEPNDVVSCVMDEIRELPWRYYAGVAGAVFLALGILWAVEDPPSPCMVASAAYGSPNAGQVAILRLFRDRFLLSNAAGTAFVDSYYRVGGVLADFVMRHSWIAGGVRAALLPVVVFSCAMLLFPLFPVLIVLVFCGLAFASAALAWGLRSRRLRRLKTKVCDPPHA